jgi:hypothetical protein
MQNDPQTPRVSRFSEGTMNSTASIHPPDLMYMELGIDDLIKIANGDQQPSAPASEATKERAAPGQVASASADSHTQTHTEGIFGRFSRAAASLFRGSGFGGLGKRKEREGEEKKLDRREEAERAYAEAKARGLLPQPKVFVRPIKKARSSGSDYPTCAQVDEGDADRAYLAGNNGTPVESPAPAPPPTPTRFKSTSKKDLNKQLKLSKRVSDLEHKLNKARKELAETLGEEVPPVPSLPTPMPTFPPTPDTNTSNFFSQDETSPHIFTEEMPAKGPKKITKKRKVSASASASDSDYKPVAADSESEGSEKGSKRSKLTEPNLRKSPRKKSSRILKKKKSNVTKENVVIIVPDGVTVPAVPSIPSGMKDRAAVSEEASDGYGGFGDEIF